MSAQSVQLSLKGKLALSSIPPPLFQVTPGREEKRRKEKRGEEKRRESIKSSQRFYFSKVSYRYPLMQPCPPPTIQNDAFR
jgi:hypothetical protein